MRGGVKLNVTVSPAGIAQKPATARLMQLYLHDFSAFAPMGSPRGELDQDGLINYDGFDEYWLRAGREPLLISVNNQLAGFALINDWSPSGDGVNFAIAEFFVARKYRRHGVGSLAAKRIISERPGDWEIAVASYNTPALAFWRHALLAVNGTMPKERAGDGSRWTGPIFRLQVDTDSSPGSVGDGDLVP